MATINESYRDSDVYSQGLVRRGTRAVGGKWHDRPALAAPPYFVVVNWPDSIISVSDVLLYCV